MEFHDIFVPQTAVLLVNYPSLIQDHTFVAFVFDQGAAEFDFLALNSSLGSQTLMVEVFFLSLFRIVNRTAGQFWLQTHKTGSFRAWYTSSFRIKSHSVSSLAGSLET